MKSSDLAIFIDHVANASDKILFSLLEGFKLSRLENNKFSLVILEGAHVFIAKNTRFLHDVFKLTVKQALFLWISAS